VGSVQVITNEEWTTDAYVFWISSYDNASRVAIAQNDTANDYNPDLWSRFDWYDDGTSLWYCQTAYDAASEADAEATPAATTTDPATTGCGGFSWTNLTP
jgi:hypothetical protein